MKVIKLNATSIEKVLNSVLDNHDDEDSIVIVVKKRDEIHTAYFNADMGTKQELLGHLQIDIVNEMIQANYITPE